MTQALSIYHRCLPQGSGLARVLIQRAPWVSLGWDERCKSRLPAQSSTGEPVLIVLPRGSVMRGGDVLMNAEGAMLVVRAAEQALLAVRPCSVHGQALDLLKAAYHLGNRHVAVDLRADHLRIEPDHVLADMLRQLHFDVQPLQADFEPEHGAYAGHGHGAHDHDHHHHHHG